MEKVTEFEELKRVQTQCLLRITREIIFTETSNVKAEY